jgi:hypothetical protein
MWVKLDDATTSNSFFTKRGISTQWYEYWGLAASDGRLMFYLGDTSASSVVYVSSATDKMQTATWTYIAFTYDGRGGSAPYDGMNVYINGENVTVTRAGDATYVGMQPDYADKLYIGAAYAGHSEMDGQMAEFAVWSAELSAREVGAIYNITLLGDSSIISGILNNPPRTILQARDNATGSYPTVSRIGDPNRTGRYAVNFNDTNTLIFNSSVTTSYPSDLSPADQKYIDQQVATPNTNSTILTPGTIRKGVADANISLTPGEDFSPFKEVSLYASTAEAMTDPFYLTGSAVSDVGLGFSQPLDAKIKLRIPMPALSTTTLGAFSEDNIRPMAYYNFKLSRWDIIGQPMDARDVGNNASAAAVANRGLMTGSCVGFSRGMEMLYDNPQVNCQPVTTFGFPMDARYAATGSQAYSMSNLIDRPFLVEKVILRVSASSTQPTDSGLDRSCLFFYAGTRLNDVPNPGVDSPSDIYLRSPDSAAILSQLDSRIGDTAGYPRTPYAAIHSFFILNQRSPFTTQVTNPVVNMSPAGTGMDVDPVTSSLPTSTFLNTNETPTWVTSSRDMVTYMQVMCWGGSGTGYQSYYPMQGVTGAINLGLGRELNFYGSYAAFTGRELLISGTVRSTRTLPQAPQWRWKTYDNELSKATRIMPAASGGRRADIMSPTGRDLVRSVPGSPRAVGPNGVSQAVAFDFGDAHDGQGTTNTFEIERFVPTDNVSPYLLEPSDELVVGCQVPLAWGLTRSADSGTGGLTELIESDDAELILYGSLVSKDQEHHPGLNQHLTSDAVHELVGFHGPPLDQFDTEPRQQFNGTMASNVVTGSIQGPFRPFLPKLNPLGGRGVVGERAVGTWTGGQVQEYGALAVEQRDGAQWKPGGFSRTIVLGSDSETFYDSYVPTLGDFFDLVVKDVSLTSGGYYYYYLGYHGSYATFFDWWGIFPFESTFSTLERSLVAKYSTRGENSFGGVGVWIPALSVSWVIRAGLPDPTYLFSGGSNPATIAQVNRLAFGIGDDYQGSPSIIMWNTSTGGFGFGHVRGFKYGVFHSKPQPSHAQFRYDTYGQFRDMMEQRLDSRMLVQRHNRKSLTDGPVRCRFVNSSGRSADPSSTPSSNLSIFATSSLPYFDGVSRNRQPIVQAQQDLVIVGV